MKQLYTIGFKNHKVLAALGHLKYMIPEAKIVKLSLTSAKIEIPIYEEQTFLYIFENEECKVAKTRTYNT